MINSGWAAVAHLGWGVPYSPLDYMSIGVTTAIAITAFANKAGVRIKAAREKDGEEEK